MQPARWRETAPVTPWILLAALLNAAGWLLSALHALNPVGYAVVFGLALAAAWRWPDELGVTALRRISFRRWRRRCRRFFPVAFFVIAGLALLGGILHAPNNYDALAYRMPRVLHWLAAEQWHWINTDFVRLNTRAPGYEWLMAPIMLFLQSHRLVFLIGIISLLLLPGLVFSLFTRLGVARHAAWHWMWLVPTGYSFVAQAGGVGNDILGGMYALAALDLAVRARKSQRLRDILLAGLAGGLLTGAKTSNLPLALPCVLALWPCWRVLLKRPVAAAAIAGASLWVSFVPMAALNYWQCKDWSGAKAEDLSYSSGDPRILVPGNLMILAVQNLAPPVFPFAARWNASAPGFMPASFHQAMRKNFEPSGANLALTEIQNEEFSGFGLGLCGLVALSVVAGGRRKRAVAPARPEETSFPNLRLVRWSPYVSATAYLVKAAIGTAARIFTPYYALMLPLLLSGPEQARLCRQRWWRAAAAVVFVLAALVVVITPSRPLFPAQTILRALTRAQPDNAKWPRALTVYSVYALRADGLAPVREKLPPGEKLIGLVTFDELESTLWLPYGTRRFEHVTSSDTREAVLKKGIEYVVVSGWLVDRPPASTIETWAAKFGATVETVVPLRLRAGRDAMNWYICRLHGERAQP